jgi:glyoxylase-like metal-dependent hydrolase (beta-lactamase superfamily II)
MGATRPCVWEGGAMIRKVLLGMFALVALALLAAGVALALAHAAIDRERAALPSRAEVISGGTSGERPVRLRVANTASQAMPRSGVLDPKLDPTPDEPYVMSHPSFVLEWADGHILLVDLGMDRAGALRFGRPIELLSGGSPIEPHASTAAQLGPAAERVEGIVFTHLHTDHVGGITELCRGRTRPLRVFMTEAQEKRTNYTTRPGRELLASVKRGAQGAGDAPCIEVVPLASGGLQALPGFPGAFVIAAGGHTPGSQIVVATVDDGSGPKQFGFTGDIVNNITGIDRDVPKPPLYRLLVVPESDERQTELRHFLRDLRDAGGVRLLVSHDERQLAATGIPPLTASGAAPVAASDLPPIAAPARP